MKFINFTDIEGLEFLINLKNIISIEELNNVNAFEIDLNNGQHIWIDREKYNELKLYIIHS